MDSSRRKNSLAVLYLTPEGGGEFYESLIAGEGTTPWEFRHCKDAGDASLDEEIARADVILCQGASLSAEQMEAARNCKLVIHAGPGPAGLDLELARRLGIEITSVPDGATIQYADMAIGAIDAALRNIRSQRKSVGAGSSGTSPQLRLGILGLGSVGREVAKQATGHGLQLWACDPFVIAETFVAARVREASLSDLLGICDVVTVHASAQGPGGPDERALIGAEELDWMKPDAWIVNTSDSELVDGAALLARLTMGRPFGAAMLSTKELERSAEEADRREDLKGLLESRKIVKIDAGALKRDAIETENFRRGVAIANRFFESGDVARLIVDPPLPRSAR